MEVMQPLVSILIPAYNAEQWIAQTVRSALAQTWPRKEIIVIDDGSTDQTARLVEGVESGSVRFVRQKNAGASAARNHALSFAQGDYIQWLDADDLLAPDKISLQMLAAQRLKTPRSLFACGWGSFSYRPTRAQFVPTPLWEDLAPLEWLLRKMETNAHMQTATWLISRQLTQAAGPWDTRLTMDDDGEYFSRVLRASDAVRFVPEARVFYRITDSSRLSNVGRNSQKMESQLLSMKLQIGYLLALSNTQRARAACLTYLRTWLPTFYPDRIDLVEEAMVLAQELGGRLDLPRLNWKYGWIERLFGSHAGKQAQLRYNQCKSSLTRSWDKTLSLLEGSKTNS